MLTQPSSSAVSLDQSVPTSFDSIPKVLIHTLTTESVRRGRVLSLLCHATLAVLPFRPTRNLITRSAALTVLSRRRRFSMILLPKAIPCSAELQPSRSTARSRLEFIVAQHIINRSFLSLLVAKTIMTVAAADHMSYMAQIQ